MDITMLPPSAILSHHSHHVYHPPPPQPAPTGPHLLPSALPRRPSRFSPSYSYTPCPHHADGFHTYRYKPRIFESGPPTDGSSPISALPDDLWIDILKYLDWQDLLKTRSVDRRLASLALSASLHQSLTLTSLPPTPLPPLMTRYLLPPVKHLHLHLFPYPSATAATHPSMTMHAIINAIPTDQLRSLSLPFSAPYLSASELGEILRRTGGRLEKLDLRGSGVAGKSWNDWIGHVGKSGAGLQELDLGFTNITELPSMEGDKEGKKGETSSTSKTTIAGRLPIPPPDGTPPDPFRNLTSLSLASCTSISATSIYTFLENLPPSLQTLDISRLEQTSFEALWNMKVVYRSQATGGELRPTSLREIKVVGIDHLTRLDIRRLKRHWETQRRACDCFPPIDELRQSVQVKQKVWGEPSVSPADMGHDDEYRTPETLFASHPHLPTPPQTPVGLRRHSQSTSPFSATSLTPSSSVDSTSSALHRITSSPVLLTPESSQLELSPPPPSSYNDKHPFLRSPPSTTTYHDMARPVTPSGLSRELQERADIRAKVSVNILHSAILESEDEAGYRQFIGEVAGGTVGLGFMDWEDEP